MSSYFDRLQGAMPASESEAGSDFRKRVAQLAEANAARQSSADTADPLYQVDVTVTEVADFWVQQNLVKNFYVENSDENADIEMCRSLPIFIYADQEIDLEVIKGWVASMGFTQLAILPPLAGSWFQRMFASQPTPVSGAAFWNALGAKEIIEHAGKLSVPSRSLASF